VVICDGTVDSATITANFKLELEPIGNIEDEIVGASADDGYEEGDGTINTAANEINIYSNPNTTLPQYKCGLFKFENIDIPKNSVIENASIELYVKVGPNNDANFIIYAEDNDNAADLTTNPHVISETDRPRTSAGVSWAENDLAVGYDNSPDISSAIQEVIDRTGWTSGNNLAIICIANTDLTLLLDVDSVDDINHPKLHITYTPPVTFDGRIMIDDGTDNTTIWQRTDGFPVDWTSISEDVLTYIESNTTYTIRLWDNVNDAISDVRVYWDNAEFEAIVFSGGYHGEVLRDVERATYMVVTVLTIMIIAVIAILVIAVIIRTVRQQTRGI